eukprot:45653-Eustigmatos_ZCMA.PRE.1
MEPAQCEEQLLVLALGLATLEMLLSDQVVELEHVSPQPARRLGGHLDAPLQDGDGELGVRA